MSVLSAEQRLHVLAALVDGNSERATERMTQVDRKTIRHFALKLGRAAQWLHNTQARDLSFSCIEKDEVWSYVKKKQRRVTPDEHARGLGAPTPAAPALHAPAQTPAAAPGGASTAVQLPRGLAFSKAPDAHPKQIDLFTWRAPKGPPVQLGLFDRDPSKP